MARDLSRFRLPHRHDPEFDPYEESHYLPPEVAAYLEMRRRRPHLVRGIIAGSLIALAGIWVILYRRRRETSLSYALPSAVSAPAASVTPVTGVPRQKE